MTIGDRSEAVAVPRRRRKGKGMPSGFASVRDLISFVAGMGIIGNEIFLSDKIEIYAIGVGVALAGLPVVFGADERKGSGA
jgi:hypothetical protein